MQHYTPTSFVVISGRLQVKRPVIDWSFYFNRLASDFLIMRKSDRVEDNQEEKNRKRTDFDFVTLVTPVSSVTCCLISLLR